MGKRLLILANSRKHSGRCVAGKDSEGNWVRITKCGEGAIPLSEALYYNVLNVVEFEGLVNMPSLNYNYHSENSVYTGATLLGALGLDRLDYFLDTPKTIFGPGRQLERDEAEKLDNSLLFVKVQNFNINWINCGSNGMKIRADFIYNGMHYTDISVTDAFVESRFKASGYSHSEKYDEAYITVSLGVPFYGRTYKLISGIIVA